MFYKIKDQYTDTPGGRYKSDGEFSGEEFRENVLKELFKKAVDSNKLLTIDLDDTYGYPSSFLEEAFGGLAREFGVKTVQKHIRIISNDDPMQIQRIEKYIKNAVDKKEL